MNITYIYIYVSVLIVLYLDAFDYMPLFILMKMEGTRELLAHLIQILRL